MCKVWPNLRKDWSRQQFLATGHQTSNSKIKCPLNQGLLTMVHPFFLDIFHHGGLVLNAESQDGHHDSWDFQSKLEWSHQLHLCACHMKLKIMWALWPHLGTAPSWFFFKTSVKNGFHWSFAVVTGWINTKWEISILLACCDNFLKSKTLLNPVTQRLVTVVPIWQSVCWSLCPRAIALSQCSFAQHCHCNNAQRFLLSPETCGQHVMICFPSVMHACWKVQCPWCFWWLQFCKKQKNISTLKLWSILNQALALAAAFIHFVFLGAHSCASATQWPAILCGVWSFFRVSAPPSCTNSGKSHFSPGRISCWETSPLVLSRSCAAILARLHKIWNEPGLLRTQIVFPDKHGKSGF